jgi:hypothetical protein
MWEDNLEMNLGEIGWCGTEWIVLTQDRDQWTALVKTVMNLRVSQLNGKFMSNCTIVDFSGRVQIQELVR